MAEARGRITALQALCDLSLDVGRCKHGLEKGAGALGHPAMTLPAECCEPRKHSEVGARTGGRDAAHSEGGDIELMVGAKDDGRSDQLARLTTSVPSIGQHGIDRA